MRADMFKVVVERPRWGSSHARAAKLKRKTDKNIKFIGHKRHAWEATPYTKSLNENLAPLERFLTKQRGRKWDDVFSEICEHLDTGSTVKMHIREHLEDFIMVKIHIDANGRWLGQGRWGSVRTLDDAWGWPDLYVDPIDGRIKETAALRRRFGIKQKRYRSIWLGEYDLGPHDDFRRLAHDHVLLRRKGIWFEILLNQRPECCDDKLRHDLRTEAWKDHGAWAVRSMKQLSKKELKAHKLENSGNAG
ncbi:MAG: hypothetical protein AAGK01_09045 [Pseudomonadota bacterium]